MRNSAGSGSERVWSGISTSTRCPVNRPPNPRASTSLTSSYMSAPDCDIA